MKITKIVALGALAALAGCTTPSYSEKYVASSDAAGMSVYPVTQGVVDTYRPTYKVGDKKCISNGYGESETEAIDNAIYNMCTKLKCDYVAAAKWTLNKNVSCSKNVFLWLFTFGHAHDVSFEAELIGFPVYIDSVETIKSKFYVEGADGKLTEAKPEHRTIWEKDAAGNYGWTIHMVPGNVGGQEEAKPLVLRTRTINDGATKNCDFMSKRISAENNEPAQIRMR